MYFLNFKVRVDLIVLYPEQNVNFMHSNHA